MEKLNSTGSLWLDNNYNYYSYNTKLTGTYKNLKVLNDTFYSMTTRKHQGFIKRVEKFDFVIYTCIYGARLTDYEVEKAIKIELDNIENALLELSQKRNTQKKLATIQNLNNRKSFLIKVLNK